jgi:hypothetical protein
MRAIEPRLESAGDNTNFPSRQGPTGELGGVKFGFDLVAMQNRDRPQNSEQSI